uniref:NADH:ubiquinone reductase (H(+)-translocating) n=1 Tax=Eurylepta cornuta TaxID=1879303 RepID=A0A2R3SK51_9PLAT|nr:NADH dehydrogenase subunit 5 [Eurylepta cornuta]
MKSHLHYVSNLFLLLGVVVFGLTGNSFMFSWNVADLGSCSLDLLVLVDWVSLTFFFTLSIIVSCVLKFSSIYMENEKFFLRFHFLVYSFVFSMFCLIFFPHFFFLLVGWDGLGITSFLLVIYYLSSSSWAAGMKTYLINRLGDGLFLVALGLLLIQGHWDINGIANNQVYWGFILVLVLGCFTKSAQFPFSSWLPAAMAAPTPVSSLVHSSTLVTAGIYLLIRFSSIIPNWMFFFIGVMGLWTLYGASLAACFECDAKKIVAYSTLSQLGFMVVSISSGLENFAFFHLITHAMFKAMMFICVGYFMVNNNHFQDFRSLSGMWKCSPFVSISLVVSGLSLIGFPFMSGFFSKELVLESNLFCVNEVFFNLLLLSLPLTSFYASRLIFQLFNGNGYNVFSRCNDNSTVLMSLIPLYLGSILIGSLGSSFFLSNSFLYPSSYFKLFVNFLIFSGVSWAWIGVNNNSPSFNWFYSEILYTSPFNGNFWVDGISDLGEDINYLFDQGSLSNFIFNMDFGILKAGGWVSNMYYYFLSPSVGLYIILGFLVLSLSWYI